MWLQLNQNNAHSTRLYSTRKPLRKRLGSLEEGYFTGVVEGVLNWHRRVQVHPSGAESTALSRCLPVPEALSQIHNIITFIIIILYITR